MGCLLVFVYDLFWLGLICLFLLIKAYCLPKVKVSYLFWSVRECESERMKSFSRVWLFEAPWTVCLPQVARQAPPSMGFSRQEYWSGSPFPSPRDLPDPGMEPTAGRLSHTAGRLSHTPGRLFTIWATREPTRAFPVHGVAKNQTQPLLI